MIIISAYLLFASCLGPKKQGFWTTINCIQMKSMYLVNSSTWLVVRKCQNLTFKVNFLRQKSFESFRIFFSIKNTSLGANFLLKFFFDNFNFWTPLLLKSCPIFGILSVDECKKIGNFIWLQLIFGRSYYSLIIICLMQVYQSSWLWCFQTLKE